MKRNKLPYSSTRAIGVHSDSVVMEMAGAKHFPTILCGFSLAAIPRGFPKKSRHRLWRARHDFEGSREAQVAKRTSHE